MLAVSQKNGSTVGTVLACGTGLHQKALNLSEQMISANFASAVRWKNEETNHKRTNKKNL